MAIKDDVSKSNALNAPKNYHQSLVKASLATTGTENHLEFFAGGAAAAQVTVPPPFFTSRPPQKVLPRGK